GGGGASAAISAMCVNALCREDLSQAGSASSAAPGTAKAWQRQPPQSRSRRGQDRQGSRIPAGPAKGWEAPDMSQMFAQRRSRTLSKVSPGMVSAAWQGRTLPDGVMVMLLRPQPPMHGFGRRA